jgi:DNA primase
LVEQAMDVFDRKVQLLQRAGWFNDLQHKRRALDRLLPTIRAASDPITRDLYLARAAEAAGIAREVLLQELHAVRRGTRTTGRPAPRAAGAAPRDADAPPPGDEAAPAIFRGPYRSSVPQGAAEQTLLRVLLTQPVWQDLIVEELGKLEMEDLPSGGDADAFAEEQAGVLRDPVYAALYASALRHGAEADAETFTSGLDAREIHVYETLRGEAEAVVDAKRSIADAIRQLRGRSVDARIAELTSILPLADEAQKDAIIGRINKLTEEKRALGVSRWGAVRR